MSRLKMALLGVGLLAVGCGGEQEQSEPAQGAAPQSPATTQPAPSAQPETAPEQFSVVFETSAGDFTVLVERRLAPHGADRFYELVKSGFFDDQRFFRVAPGFVIQWGLSGDPAVTARWANARIPDDPVVGSNVKGTLSFAATGQPGSRTTQVFVNLADNVRLDSLGFAPFGRVTEGMDVVESINAEYGESPNQGQIRQSGNEYLNREFPNLDYIQAARLVE